MGQNPWAPRATGEPQGCSATGFRKWPVTAVLGEALSRLPEQNVDAQAAKELSCASYWKDKAGDTS